MKQQQINTRSARTRQHRTNWLRLGALESLLAMRNTAQAADCVAGAQTTTSCTVPANVLAITATVTGGGGGGDASGTDSSGGAGGAGGVLTATLGVASGNTLTITASRLYAGKP